MGLFLILGIILWIVQNASALHPRKNFSTNTAVINGLLLAVLNGDFAPKKSDLLLGFSTPPETATNNFTVAWKNFTNDSQLLHATYSMTILDNSTGNLIFESNKNIGLAPASTLKTITGAAALHYLGSDYQYETLLQYSGVLDDYGVLDGYIYIVGDGDPTLGSSRWNETNGDTIMERWVSSINEVGIKQCRGIVADLSVWSDDVQTIPDGYIWQDIGNYYGTGNSVLNWRENQFRLILSPGNAVGDPVILVALDRPPPSLAIINQATTGPQNTGDRTNLYLTLDGTHAYLRGTLSIDSAKNISIGGAIPDSGLYIADELRKQMRWSNDVSISTMLKTDAFIHAVTDRTTMDVHRSPPISDILYWFEQASINLYGEILIKTIAHKINSSSDTILPTYCQNQHEIEPTAIATIDGSGLSPENRVTTWALARVLFDIQRASWFSIYERALPIFNGIRMKNGYIRHVYSYAGYVNKYVFSIIVNNFNGDINLMRQKILNLLDTLK